ncbi:MULTISPECIES: DNA-binding protein [unclassified Bradyrhizobium]|uniref:type II toxin-antitoxin system VapC family toxin n=1 Tax=unclassified Bradyrhizobium TaxID=2631580 RepID=UPI002479C600|nr:MULTISPECIES: DNA-binding protein [unclassified Bradyrhizobium]WGR73055.1 DNA-binding protein [Bradyrhizobium sp. ISRA426]WGR77892.1 DNA-binding protein [Bradyrhizobium sp. ISRA430]WGR88295.1 DNA-binding protein [Bradyrhizobium sp. ISRA432]
MAEFDFDAARRWARFDPENTLARRTDDELPFVSVGLTAGQGLLLDTCVYIDQMQDRSPSILDDLITHRQVNHSTVAIQELMYTVGALNPSDARTASVLDVIGKQIKAMPPHRIFAPDIDVLGRAALLSGILCRLQGYEKDGKLRALQDCVLFLQGQKLGLVVLTANVADYDILLQLIPTGRVLLYRPK